MVLSMQDSRWYALQVFSNQEVKVKMYLEKFATQDGVAIDEVLVPSEKVVEIKNGKRYHRVKKFYPGYVFVRMKLYNEEEKLLQSQWYFVRNVQGVLNFVGGERPVPLREDEVTRILDQAKAAATAVPVQRVQFEIGSKVKITNGPFAESLGEVGELDLENGKMRVSVSLFGRETPVELEFWQAEIIKE
ncbi:MAG: transcription termination/antitermination protein NusG [Puniceicoccales bacterium]|jgi:transcriptional antiterminator NusG|nr:transcription termination/antitermination protein NusG [Puniceicoccales bacterium]